MKEYAFRLHRGDDLLGEIKNYAKKNHIEAAVILSAVGCVSNARIRDASGVRIREIKEDMEIVSITGTVSEKRTHLHISLSKNDLTTIGGHLKEGTIVNTTAEVVLLGLMEIKFEEEFDPETGYNELKIN
ncbi:PPC domain-containing DNA-binding protein [Velocimicrobium porci]|uniref:DNA-binding protein n=1 Tax=Velocimicrobium porci TaxID=2606634 RepID=A0A6L5XUP5_9FIRM|nr:PPC domain-containing DNA-binding protein [Velocimicrobium porci]MSS62526.1 DNA-binding protein [Velocimicrobium porci]